jgi:mRNA interferase HigB
MLVSLFALCYHPVVNVISKLGLMDLLRDKSRDVQTDALAWYRTARSADWDSFAAIRRQYPDADLVNGLLVFNIRQNRYRLIVYPVFSRRKLYVKALLTHKEYDRKEWESKWP